MIIDYGFSITGKSHLAKGTCCQDAHKIKRLDNGWIIAAVADGVGSAGNSHIGSGIAVETAVSVCEEFMPWDYSIISIKSMMRTAYNYALKQILREAEKSGEPVESYDTTLTMVIYDGNRIIYGHSGDGGIIGLNSFGSYVPITVPQKGEDGVSVIPLRAGYTQWEINTYEEELAAVLIMTDGMLDAFTPYLIRLQEGAGSGVYPLFASFFADPAGFAGTHAGSDEASDGASGEASDGECETGVKERIDRIRAFMTAEEGYDPEEFYSQLEAIYKERVPEKAEEFLKEIKENGFPLMLMQKVQDDKTVVGIINTEAELDSNEEEYYREPDWNALQENWNRIAYPHLYKEKKSDAGTKADTDAKASESVPETKTSENVPKRKTSENVPETGIDADPDIDEKSYATTAPPVRYIDADPDDTADKNKKNQPVTPLPPISAKQPAQPARTTMHVQRPPRELHDRPRKKSILGKIGDFIDEQRSD